jgi:hypothetical protein
MSPAIGAIEFQAAVEINGRLVDTFLLVLAALFSVVNPPGSAFVFLSLTQHASAEVRRSLARRVSINAFFVMTASLLLGALLLKIHGISVPVLRIAGGVPTQNSESRELLEFFQHSEF